MGRESGSMRFSAPKAVMTRQESFELGPPSEGAQEQPSHLEVQDLAEHGPRVRVDVALSAEDRQDAARSRLPHTL